MPVVVQGADVLLKELKNYGPNLYKQYRLEIAAALKPIVAEARGFVPTEPMRGLRSVGPEKSVWKYDAAKVRSGITYKAVPSKVNRGGFVAVASILNKTPMGAIAETAGRKNPHGQPWVGPKQRVNEKKVSHSYNKNAGQQFIANLGPLYGDKNDKGRYIYRAFENNRGKAQDAVVKSIYKVSATFEKKTTLGRAA